MFAKMSETLPNFVKWAMTSPTWQPWYIACVKNGKGKKSINQQTTTNETSSVTRNGDLLPSWQIKIFWVVFSYICNKR